MNNAWIDYLLKKRQRPPKRVKGLFCDNIVGPKSCLSGV